MEKFIKLSIISMMTFILFSVRISILLNIYGDMDKSRRIWKLMNEHSWEDFKTTIIENYPTKNSEALKKRCDYYRKKYNSKLHFCNGYDGMTEEGNNHYLKNKIKEKRKEYYDTTMWGYLKKRR